MVAFDVLVLFFLPAGISLGQAVQFLGLVIMLALLGPCSWWAATWQASPEPRVTSTDNQERKIVS
jgi:hypothetical protein